MTTSPWGGTVVDPVTASIGAVLPDSDGTGQSLTIDQYKPRTLINWTSFDTGAESTVMFKQKTTDVAINRVIGNLGPTQFFGTLSAAGRIFLINTNGFMFGSGATLNVGSLLASTSDLKNVKDWNKKDLDFSGGETPVYAQIINNGSITITSEGGFGALIAPYVENNGTLTNGEQAAGVESSLIAATEFKVRELPENKKEESIVLSSKDPDKDPFIELKDKQPSSSDFSGAEGPFGVTQNSTGLTRAESGFVRLTNMIYDATVNVSGELDADQLALGESGGAILISNYSDGQIGDILFNSANVHARGGALAGDNNPVRVVVRAGGNIGTLEGGGLSSFTVCAEGGASQACLDSEHYLPPEPQEGGEFVLFKGEKPGKESNAVLAHLNFQAGSDGKSKVNGYGSIDVALDADVSAHFSDGEDGIELLGAMKGGPKSRVYTEARASFESGGDIALSGDHIKVAADYANNSESYGGYRPDALASLDVHAPWNISMDYQEIGVEADARVTFGNAAAVTEAAISTQEGNVDIQVAGDTFKVRANATNGFQVTGSYGYGGLALSSNSSSSSGYGGGVRVYRNGDAVALASLDLTAGEGVTLSGHTQVEANALIDNLPEFEGGSETYWGNALADADLDILAGRVDIRGDTEVRASAVHNTWETWQVGGFGGADADAEIYARGGDVTIDGDLTVAALQRGNTSWSTQDVWRPEYLYQGGDDFEPLIVMKQGDDDVGDDDADQYQYGVQQGAEADLDIWGNSIAMDGGTEVTALSENNAGRNWGVDEVRYQSKEDQYQYVGSTRAEAMAELVAYNELNVGQNGTSSITVKADAKSGTGPDGFAMGYEGDNHSATASAMLMAASGTEGRGYPDQYQLATGDMNIKADIDVAANAISQAYAGDRRSRSGVLPKMKEVMGIKDLVHTDAGAMAISGVVLGSAGDMTLEGSHKVTANAQALKPVTYPDGGEGGELFSLDGGEQGEPKYDADAQAAAFFIAAAGDGRGIYDDGQATQPTLDRQLDYEWMPSSSLVYDGELEVLSNARSERGSAGSLALGATLANGDVTFHGPVHIASEADATGEKVKALSTAGLVMMAGLNIDYVGLMGDARMGVAEANLWDAFDQDDDLGWMANPMQLMAYEQPRFYGDGLITPDTLDYTGDILVESRSVADNREGGGPPKLPKDAKNLLKDFSSGSLGFAFLGAGGDTYINTDPVIVDSTALATEFDRPDKPKKDDDKYEGRMAAALSGLVTVAGLDSLEEMYRNEYDWDEVEKYDLNIIGNHEARAYAATGEDVAETSHPTGRTGDKDWDWDTAFSLNALLATGDIRVRGNDPLARSDEALAQGRETRWAGCDDDQGCDDGLGFGLFRGYPETAQLLILAGGAVYIQPKGFLDTITPYEEPTRAPTGDPGNLPLRFAANGDMLVATGVGVTTPPSIEAMNLDIESALAAGGDPTTLLAPTAAGPGSQAGLSSGQDAFTTTGPDFCDKLVAGACLGGETQ